MKRVPVAILGVVLITLSTLHSSAAEEREPWQDQRGPPARDYHRERHPQWGGEIHRFQEHDLARWQAGRWFHGRHEGRHGWWWIVGGLWYFYPVPIYPYPDPYHPPVGRVPPAPPTPAPPLYWYYCPNPPGYYPYVAQCAAPWQRVQASAPPP